MTERSTTKAKQRALNTTAPPPVPETISWEDAVAEGKRVVTEKKRLVTEADTMTAKADQYGWRLGELADAVGTQYGEKSLAKFATAIGVAPCTVKRHRTTYRHWKKFLSKSAPGRFLYSVARELESHPDKERLITDKPNMTKREAAALMKAYRNKPETEMKRWWKDLIVRVFKAQADGDILKVDGKNFLNTDRQNLLRVVNPLLLSDLRDAGQVWIRLADALEKLFPKPKNKASFDTRRDAQVPALPDGPA
jgi:hypothetical protein